MKSRYKIRTTGHADVEITIPRGGAFRLSCGSLVRGKRKPGGWVEMSLDASAARAVANTGAGIEIARVGSKPAASPILESVKAQAKASKKQANQKSPDTKEGKVAK